MPLHTLLIVFGSWGLLLILTILAARRTQNHDDNPPPDAGVPELPEANAEPAGPPPAGERP